MRQILFQIGKRKTFTETFQMLQQAYGEDCLSRTQCHEWYQRFKWGRTSIEEDHKSGRPSTAMDDDHVEKVLAVIRQNRRLPVLTCCLAIPRPIVCADSTPYVTASTLLLRRHPDTF